MKAKEYLERFEKVSEEFGDREATLDLMNGFLREIATLTEVRRVHSNAAMLSILRELNQKWDALCRLDKHTRFKKGGFIKLVRHKVTKDYPHMAGRILPELDKI